MESVTAAGCERPVVPKGSDTHSVSVNDMKTDLFLRPAVIKLLLQVSNIKRRFKKCINSTKKKMKKDYLLLDNRAELV